VAAEGAVVAVVGSAEAEGGATGGSEAAAGEEAGEEAGTEVGAGLGAVEAVGLGTDLQEQVGVDEAEAGLQEATTEEEVGEGEGEGAHRLVHTELLQVVVAEEEEEATSSSSPMVTHLPSSSSPTAAVETSIDRLGSEVFCIVC
jgi:hypothetical protein